MRSTQHKMIELFFRVFLLNISVNENCDLNFYDISTSYISPRTSFSNEGCNQSIRIENPVPGCNINGLNIVAMNKPKNTLYE